jgi:quercetin dioxygenase-like cupin family protein
MSEPRFLVDPYKEWVGAEGIPVHEGFGLDLLEMEVAPWPRLEAKGAFAHLTGRGDFVDMQIVEITPGGKTAPQRHLYEEVVYVLAGRGSTSVESPSGERHSFEWQTGSLFAIPLNGSYRHYNGSGTEPARIVAVTDLPLILNVFRDEDFIWNNPRAFPERFGEARRFRGDGTFLPMRPGRHMWETNFVPDLRTFELKEWKARGAGGSNIMFVLADGTMHAHMSEMPVGTYKKGHRHGPDFHVLTLKGNGYSLFWREGDADFIRIDWKPGVVFAPVDQIFHQHFNTSPDPSRYLALAMGSLRYPLTAQKRAIFLGVDQDVKKGGAQIEYEDQDPRIHKLFLQELKKNGVKSGMGEIFNEGGNT